MEVIKNTKQAIFKKFDKEILKFFLHHLFIVFE